MILLGPLAFFQLIFIPGYIFLNIFKFKSPNKLQTIIYSFSLSLLINYLLVYYLTLIKAYNAYVIYSLLVIEFFYLVYLSIKKRNKFNINFKFTNIKLFNIKSQNLLLKDIFFTICIFITAGFFYFFISNLGSIFSNWDPVFSWNRWAIDWYLGGLPKLTDYYPQLIPANWSITYIIMQNHYIQLFAKSIMPLFTIFNLFLFLDLYLAKRNITYLVGLLIYATIILGYGLIFVKTGYVDIPVSFFSFLTISEIVKAGRSSLSLKRIVLIILFSSAAALTKQGGLFILFFSIGWVLCSLIRHKKEFSNSRITKKIAIVLSIVLFNLSWYIIKIIKIAKGFDVTLISYLIRDIHRGRNYIERFMYGLSNLHGSLILFVFLLLLVILSVFNKKVRLISTTITLPLIIAWGFWFSYDNRNLIATFPFIAYSSAFGISYIYEKIFKDKIISFNSDKLTQINKRYLFIKQKLLFKISKFKLEGKYILATFFILLTVTSFILSFFSNKVLKQQIGLQKHLGNFTIDKMLYEYKNQNNIDGKILTDYYWATALPGFEGSTIKVFNENDNFVILSNGVVPTKFLELIDSSIYGFLISDRYYYAHEFNPEIKKKLSNGKFSLIFSNQGYHFVKINK